MLTASMVRQGKRDLLKSLRESGQQVKGCTLDHLEEDYVIFSIVFKKYFPVAPPVKYRLRFRKEKRYGKSKRSGG